MRALVVAALLIAVLLVGAVAFLSSQAGVDIAVRELIARSDGRLEVEDATGSLLDTVRVRRLVWRGPGATSTATDVALTWSPVALWSRRLVIHGFGTQRLTFDLKPSDTPAQLPVTLTLPMEVTIERIGVAQLDWHVGKNRGTIHGLEFSYAGGAIEHRISKLALVADVGTVSGDVMIGASLPYAIGGNLQFKGAAALKDVDGALRLSGTLATLSIDGSGRAGDARVGVHAALAPLGAVLLHELALDATDVDIAAWKPTLPKTRVALAVHAQPVDGGLTGTVNATNALAGSLDVGRVPLRAFSARFAWRADALAFEEIVAEFHGGGRASGQAQIPLTTANAAGKWALDVHDVDLRRMYASLNTTRLRGRISADLNTNKPKISGEIADRDIAGGLALGFAVVVADGRIDVERFHARAGPGELEGHGRVALAGERAFRLDATAKHFDPARLGNFPAGNLVGTIAATGVLAPAWHVDASLVVAPGSRLAGIALSGTARGSVARDAIRDATVDLQIGSAKLAATGSTGRADDRIMITLDAPRLAELAPLFPAQARTLAGAVHAKAELRGLLPQAGIDAEVKGEGLKLGPSFALRTVNARFAVAPGTAGAGGGDLASRTIALDVDATELVVAAGTFASARASVKGTLAQHSASIAFKGEDLDTEATAHGGLRDIRGGDIAALSWSGALDTLVNRGQWPLRLTAPATLSVSHGNVRIGETRVSVADGNVHLSEFSWDEGKIATRGDFAAVPVASAARLAGVPLPFVSTLKVGGEWSLAATPRLNGTVKLRREDGDLWLRGDGATDPKGIALGITSLELNARLSDDAVVAAATLRSTRGGSADAKLAIGAVANAPLGHVSGNAPLTLTANADLPTLQLLQPWIGTTAVVDGRARANIAARGTVDHASLTGTVNAENLRIDAPQYGVHFRDGKLAAHLADGNVVLDEMVLSAGAGQFRAAGTIATTSRNNIAPAARLTWHADNFRLFNRPDLRLVVDGEGTVATDQGKLTLSGKLRAEEGRIVYVSDPSAALGDDVVVKGWTRPSKATLRAAELPLNVDLALDLGDQLTFSGEGLDTGLQGVVRVTTASTGGFIGKGSIRAVNGTYFAFGQKLVIDPGRLIFDGPLDNPGLEIVALRKNLAVEAGVAVTGTIKAPIIALTSNPPLPDGEKLSWLVTGQGLERTSGADIAALQAASAVLLGRNSKPMTTTIAQSIGLDDISIKSATGTPRGNQRATDASGQVVAVGKRLSDKLSLVYEQGLTVASNALRLEYSVSRTLTLRAEAGTVSGVGIYYRRTFD